MTEKKVRVLLVDDSQVIRNFLKGILESDPNMEVIGTVANGNEALKFIATNHPDVVTMDINMPGMDGFETTRMIMQSDPVPVVIVSGNYQLGEVAKIFKSLEVGAVQILPRPAGVSDKNFFESAREFTRTIRAISEVKVVRRYGPRQSAIPGKVNSGLQSAKRFKDQASPGIIAIGSSAGGPTALAEIISGLSSRLPVPVVIVQHIDPVFTEGFAEWLSFTSLKQIIIAREGMEPEDGNYYLAPGGFQLGIRPDGLLTVNQDPPGRNLRPSVGYLFSSLLRSYGNRILAILLSGMGSDGASDMKLLRDAGNVTIAQNRETSMIFGMPGEAEKLGAAQYFLSPAEIVNYINGYFELNR